MNRTDGTKVLVRSGNGRMVAGICAGAAEYFGWDLNLVRVIVAVIAVISGLLMGLIYALVAVGLTLIFGLMEIVNFAHGEFLMLAMFTAFWFWALGGLDPMLSLPFVAILLAVAGILAHFGIIRRLFAPE